MGNYRPLVAPSSTALALAHWSAGSQPTAGDRTTYRIRNQGFGVSFTAERSWGLKFPWGKSAPARPAIGIDCFGPKPH
jgi:hypothetical protein